MSGRSLLREKIFEILRQILIFAEDNRSSQQNYHCAINKSINLSFGMSLTSRHILSFYKKTGVLVLKLIL